MAFLSVGSPGFDSPWVHVGKKIDKYFKWNRMNTTDREAWCQKHLIKNRSKGRFLISAV